MKDSPINSSEGQKHKNHSAETILDDGHQKIAAERAVEEALGLKAKLTIGPKKNMLTVYFETMEQLDALLAKLTS